MAAHLLVSLYIHPSPCPSISFTALARVSGLCTGNSSESMIADGVVDDFGLHESLESMTKNA